MVWRWADEDEECTGGVPGIRWGRCERGCGQDLWEVVWVDEGGQRLDERTGGIEEDVHDEDIVMGAILSLSAPRLP